MGRNQLVSFFPKRSGFFAVMIKLAVMIKPSSLYINLFYDLPPFISHILLVQPYIEKISERGGGGVKKPTTCSQFFFPHPVNVLCYNDKLL